MSQLQIGDLVHNNNDDSLFGTYSLQSDGVLHYFNLSFLDNTDYFWAVCGQDVQGRHFGWRFYSKKEFDEMLASMSVGDENCLQYGTLGPDINALIEDAQADSHSESDLDEPTKSGNELQTETEAKLQLNPEVMKSVAGYFESGLGKCDPGFKNVTEVVKFPLSDGRMVPLMVVAYTCAFGNIMLNKTIFPVQDPFLKLGLDRPKICATTFKYESTRKVVYQHVQKSTKISVGLSLGYTFGGGLQVTSPKGGDKAYDNGQIKIDGKSGNEIKFDFGLVRSYAKLKLDVYQHLVVSVPEIKCQTI